MRRKALNAIKTLLLIFAVCLVLTPTSFRYRALASHSWFDNIEVYRDITAEYVNLRTLKNNYTFLIDVKVYVNLIDRIDLLQYYKLSANETDFVIISNGVIIQSENTYYGLNPNATLAFTVKAKPTASIEVGQTITIGLKVELYESLVYRHDVAVIDVAYKTLYSLNKTFIGLPVNINVTAKNQGGFTENFTVAAYYQNTTGHYLIGKLNITNLGPSENRTLTFTWNTTTVKPCQWYTIKANATIVPGETLTANNSLEDGVIKIKMLGDVNGDQAVRFDDLFALAAAYGSKLGDPNWNPDCDFDGSGRVSFADLFALAANYGKKCI